MTQIKDKFVNTIYEDIGLRLKQTNPFVSDIAQQSSEEIYTEFKKEKDITLREFLGDLYNDLIVLTNNDKQYILNILEHYAEKSGFFERIREQFEYLESKNKHDC